MCFVIIGYGLKTVAYLIPRTRRCFRISAVTFLIRHTLRTVNADYTWLQFPGGNQRTQKNTVKRLRRLSEIVSWKEGAAYVTSIALSVHSRESRPSPSDISEWLWVHSRESRPSPSDISEWSKRSLDDNTNTTQLWHNTAQSVESRGITNSFQRLSDHSAVYETSQAKWPEQIRLTGLQTPCWETVQGHGG